MKSGRWFKRFAAVILGFALVSGMFPGDVFTGKSYAEEPEPEYLDGEGTEEEPYLIRNGEDWDLFASNINAGIEADAFYRLSVNFDNHDHPVTRLNTVGTEAHPFKGTFDGNFRTLHFQVDENSFNQYWDNTGLAPFRYICGATIRNTEVTGINKAYGVYMSGLVGYSLRGDGKEALRGNRVEGCLINVNVHNKELNKSCIVGGVVAHATDSKLTIVNTIFNGGLYNFKDYAGGLVGWSESGADLTIENCFFSGRFTDARIGCFYPGALRSPGADVTFSTRDVLYTQEPNLTDSEYLVGSVRKASYDIPDTGLYFEAVYPEWEKKAYAEAEVNGINNSYPYTGKEIIITPELTLSDGTVLQNGMDYSLVWSAEPVMERGEYILTITGRGSYHGQAEYPITVGDAAKVTPSVTKWHDGGTLETDGDVTMNKRIRIEGDVKLILSGGTTLNAAKGIRVEEGSRLTIEGEGTLIADSGEYQAGIGSDMGSNAGSIVINGGTVIATGNKGSAGIGGGLYGNGGNITINGGNVTASGGEYAPGLGGGGSNNGSFEPGSGGTIIINGGTVLSNGGEDAPGIGGGSRWDSSGGGLSGGAQGSISILGGKVTARKGENNRYAIGPGSVNGYDYGGAGSLVLGWTDPEDVYDIPRVHSGDISIKKPLRYIENGEDKGAVTAGNLPGNRTCLLVPPDMLSLSTAVIEGIAPYILYTGDVIPVEYRVLDPAGLELVKDEDYTESLTRGGSRVQNVKDSGDYTLTVTGKSPYYGQASFDFKVGGGIEVTSETTGLSGGNIYLASGNVTVEERIEVSDSATLLLAEGATLTAKKGIRVTSGNALTIDGEGTLIATGSWECAGIGGNDGGVNAAGTIVIKGGHISATGGGSAAGIGGGSRGSGGSITIEGGEVTATGGSYAAGIGGGGCAAMGGVYGGHMGDIRILGGKVTARGGGTDSYQPETYDIGPGRAHRNTPDDVRDGEKAPITLGWSENGDFIDAGTIGASEYHLISVFHYVRNDEDEGVVTAESLAGKDPDQILFSTQRGDLSYALIEGVENRYEYTGEEISFTPVVTSPEGRVLSEGEDYTLTVSRGTVRERGIYELTFTGTGAYTGARTLKTAVSIGKGTASDPFVIGDKEDWDMFSECISYGWDADAYYILSDDFNNSGNPVSKAFASAGHPFKGVFDGNLRTIEENISAESYDEEGTSLFGAMKNATIKNLTVRGNVKGDGYAAGLAGHVSGFGNIIENCVVDTIVSGLTNSNSYRGGIIGTAGNSVIAIRDTVFRGAVKSGNGTFGGFVGSALTGARISLDNCLFAGFVMNDYDGAVHPALIREEGADVTVTLNHTYADIENSYTDNPALTAGKVPEAYLSVPDSGIYRMIEAADGSYVYPVAEVKGVASTYKYTGGPILVTPVLTAPGDLLLEEGSDYVFRVFCGTDEVDEIRESGEYRIVFEGKGNWSGTEETAFSVGDSDSFIKVTQDTVSWTGPNTYLVDRNVFFSENTRIKVTGDVTLILEEGAKLTAQRGITVTKGNSLTVYGKGELYARSDSIGSAAIGGEVTAFTSDKDSGTIIINGGSITAETYRIRQDTPGAGMGSAAQGETGKIVINGGKVTASG
ncbi:MAG: hypothetical protein K6F53_11000, partial [Lachnospiraceae bacterium]|nr:hypothetical protein [Lachnospiraceae bacterium]